VRTASDRSPAKTPLAAALARARRAVFLVAGLSAFLNLLHLAAPLYMMQVYDRVLPTGGLSTLFYLTLIVVLATIALGVLDAARSAMLARLGRWIGDAVRAPVFDASLAMSLESGAARTAQPMRDLKTVSGFFGGAGITPMVDAPWAPLFLIVLFLLHPALGLVALIAGVLLFGISVANDAATRSAVNESGAAGLKSFGALESYLRNAEAVAAMAMGPALKTRFNALDDAAGRAGERAADRSAALGSLAKTIRLTAQTAVLAVGALLVLDGALAPGGMIAGSILMGRALAPVDQLIVSWRKAVSAWSARGRVEALLAAPAPDRAAIDDDAAEGRIEVDGASLLGVEGLAILSEIDFALEPGEALGVIGPSASGKTTLCRLIVGVRPPSAGAVRVDGVDAHRWSEARRAAHIGYLPQDVELFDGTIAENIARMGEPDPQAVVAAARLAGAHAMIMALKKGYDTPIGEAGALLSGGQRQRIALARAFYGDPRLLVLDEPAANLDQDGEAALQDAIAAAKARGVTVVLVAHRPAALAHVDKVLVLARGRVAAFGDRDTVLADLAGGRRTAPAVEAGRAPALERPTERRTAAS